MPSKSPLLRRAGLLLLLAPLLAAGCFDPDHPVSNEGTGDPAGGGGGGRHSGIHEGVEGRVTAPGPKPLENVAVRPRSLDEPAAAIPDLAVVSEADGHYSWTLSPGDYELSFAADGYQPASRRITVRPRQVTPLDITLEPAR